MKSNFAAQFRLNAFSKQDESRVDEDEESRIDEEEECDRDNVDITVITSSSFISALTADNTAACDKVCRSANRRLINHDVALNDASGGLAFRSSSRFAIPDEKTHLLIKVMVSSFMH